jgi:peptidyl-prolyl cis-trans isomerase B (cyclophilin B)
VILETGVFVASNKEIKAQAAARKKAYEAKLAQVEIKAKRRKNDNRFAIVVAAGAVLLALGATYGHQAVVAVQAAASPSATPVASASATTAASATPTPSASASESSAVPNSALAQSRVWLGHLNLNGHNLKIQLEGQLAPKAVANFISLAKKGFYQGVTCHRLTTAGIYVLQCGDPKGDGTGGPGYSFGPVENAPANNVYKTGYLAMARQGGNGNSMGSQFFIVYKDSTIPSDSAGGYTVFGKIVNGMQIVDQIAAAGTADGSSDGKPKLAATLGAITVQ